MAESIDDTVENSHSPYDNLVYGGPTFLGGLTGGIGAGYLAYNYLTNIGYSAIAVGIGTGLIGLAGYFAAKLLIGGTLALLSKRAYKYFTGDKETPQPQPQPR